MSLTISVADIIKNSNNPLLAIDPSWERIPLGEIAKILNGFAFKSELFNDTKGMPLIRIRDIGKNRTDCYYNGPFNESYVIKPGDLLIGMDGDFNCSRWTGENALLNQRVCKIEVNPNLYDHNFLEFVLSGYLKEINENTSSQTVKHLSSRSIAEILLPNPPLPEQHRIVARLEALLSQINAARDRLNRVPLIMKRFRQAVLAAACSGRLTEGWREENPDIEPASSILEGIKNQKKTGKKRIFRESDNSVLIDLPEKWLWVKWGLIGISQNGRLFPSKEYQSNGVRLLRPGNLDANGKLIWTEKNTRFLPLQYEKNYPEFVLRPNEIVMNLTAQSLKEEFLGRVCMTGDSDISLLNQRLARLIPINFSSQYAFWVFKSPHFRKFVDKLNTGSMIQHMFTSQLVDYDFPLPPLTEQQEIVLRVNTLFALADQIEHQVADATKRTEALTQAVLAKAFRGELVEREAEHIRKELV